MTPTLAAVPPAAAALVAVPLYAAAAAAARPLATRLCRGVERHDDGPRPVRVPAWLPPLVAALLGLQLGLHLPGAAAWLYAPAVLVFVAAVECDARTGRIPDALTLPALGVALAAAAAARDAGPFVGAGALFAVFALTAWRTKGLGVGWGDVYLVAFAGAVFRAAAGMAGAMLACVLAVVVALARRRAKEPIAFAPYLVSAYAVMATFSL